MNLKQIVLSLLLVFAGVYAANAQNPLIKRGGVLTDTMHTNRLVSTGATTGQLLQFNGTNWVPATVSATTDLGIANRTATALDVTSSNGADATVPFATNLLAGLMIAADKTKLDYITVTQAVDLDALEAASHAAVTVTDGTKIDFTLTGQNITATIVPASIENTDLAQSGASSNQVLTWNGSSWVPATQSAANVSATATSPLTAITVQGQLDELSANTHAAATVLDNARLDFSISGQQITADLAQNGATSGQVMSWNGSAWAPANTRALREEQFTATGGQTAFTIAVSQPAVSGTSVPVKVYRNGVRLFYVASAPNITQYTYSTTTVTTASNTAGDIITVEYLN